MIVRTIEEPQFLNDIRQSVLRHVTTSMSRMRELLNHRQIFFYLLVRYPQRYSNIVVI